MPVLTIRNLPDDVHRALRIRAARHGRSTEAEVREILSLAVQGGSDLKLGSALRDYAAPFGGVDLEIRRDTTPLEPVDLK